MKAKNLLGALASCLTLLSLLSSLPAMALQRMTPNRPDDAPRDPFNQLVNQCRTFENSGAATNLDDIHALALQRMEHCLVEHLAIVKSDPVSQPKEYQAKLTFLPALEAGCSKISSQVPKLTERAKMHSACLINGLTYLGNYGAPTSAQDRMAYFFGLLKSSCTSAINFSGRFDAGITAALNWTYRNIINSDADVHLGLHDDGWQNRAECYTSALNNAPDASLKTHLIVSKCERTSWVSNNQTDFESETGCIEREMDDLAMKLQVQAEAPRYATQQAAKGSLADEAISPWNEAGCSAPPAK